MITSPDGRTAICVTAYYGAPHPPTVVSVVDLATGVSHPIDLTALLGHRTSKGAGRWVPTGYDGRTLTLLDRQSAHTDLRRLTLDVRTHRIVGDRELDYPARSYLPMVQGSLLP